jgi:hypothetical protein
MKQIFFFILSASMIAACTVKDKRASTGDKDSSAKMSETEKNKALTDSANFTTIGFPDSTFKNLGKVKEGAIVEVTFRFKNTGTHNLVISDVSASCGCTVPEKPQQPYAPGEEGEIKAKFDSHGRKGIAEKELYVIANTLPSNSSPLKFRVEVTD